MQILIAEDDRVSRRILETMLRQWGHEVVPACNGKQAWEAMQAENAPKMAILDWMMPDMDGVDVCRNLRNCRLEIRPYIILLTGRENKKDLVAGINAGADDYVTKPFEPDELKVRIRAGERILDMQMEMMAVRETLQYQANHDTLTGLLNRAFILQSFQRELARAIRTSRPVSIVLADLDHFKRTNDTFGHTAGDKVLIEASERMLSKMRPYEDIARYGGEEFLVVLSACDLEGAEQMAERLRCAVADENVVVEGTALSITASFGVACSSQLENPSVGMLISMADTALYRAKTEGRNRVNRASVVMERVGVGGHGGNNPMQSP